MQILTILAAESIGIDGHVQLLMHPLGDAIRDVIPIEERVNRVLH